MASEDLQRAMARLSKGLRDSLETSGAIGHALSRGEVRESEVIDGLRPHIPQRFLLSSGEVINPGGERSLQQDIIIADQQSGTAFLASGGIGVHPIETVYATLQVKSEISPSTVGDAVENIASVKRLIADDPRPRVPNASAISYGNTTQKPYGAIFAFSATADLARVGEAFLAANAAIPFPPQPVRQPPRPRQSADRME